MRLIDTAEDTPDVIVDLGIVRRNIERAATVARANGVALRPHAKTHKLPRLARMQVDAGAAGVMVAKLGEAEAMVEAGLDDLLIGYPLVGDRKLQRLEALLDRGARVTVTADSMEVATGLAALGRDLPVLLELDTGLARLGYRPGAEAIEAGREIAALDGLQLVGVLTHEGHVYRQATTPDEVRQLAQQAARACVNIASALGVPVVSMGASGTFAHTAAVPGVTEVRPGTYVFNDLSQIAIGACTAEDVAAVVVATVVARPERTRVVVDAGSKTLTSDRLNVRDAPTSFGRLWQRDGTVVRISEEHGVIEVPTASGLKVGTRVAIIPNHICPVVNLVDEVTVVDGSSVERWKVTARGKVQ